MVYSDFEKYAMSNGISSLSLNRFKNAMQNVQANIISPNIVEERTGNPLQMDVFSKLFTNRILFLGTAIDSDVANIINSQLLYLQMDNKDKEVSLYINSPGGSVYDGLSIYDTMQFIDCPVHTTCIGLAASMASVILAAGENGHRQALKHSRILIHQPMSGIAPGSQASDIQIVNDEIQKLKCELFGILSEHSGQDYETMVKLGDRDCWLRATEAKELGIIDKVIEKEKK